ncbi:MAG: CNNM domain-containing protein, partial [Oscillospiraceae bacterium]
MDDGHTWYLIITLLFLVLCGYFTASASAIIGVNDAALKEKSESGDHRAKQLYHRLHDSSGFVDRIRGGSLICAVAAAGIGSVGLGDALCRRFFLWMPEAPVLATILALLIAVLLVAFAVVSFGFKIPQVLGSRYCEKFGYGTVGLLKILLPLFAPLGLLIRGFSFVIAKMLGADPEKAQEEITEEEIRMLVDVGNEIGFIEESEKDMINNIFEFDDTTAGEV